MQRDVTGAARRNGFIASCSEPGWAFRGCVAASEADGWGLLGPRLCLLWEAVHPIRRHYTPSDRVHRDVTGAARRNGCSASRADLVLQLWSALVTDSGCGCGSAWTPPILTAPVCASRSYVCQRRSRDTPEDHKQGRGPSRVARAPPIAVRPARASRRCCDDRCAHQMRSVVTDWRNV